MTDEPREWFLITTDDYPDCKKTFAISLTQQEYDSLEISARGEYAADVNPYCHKYKFFIERMSDHELKLGDLPTLGANPFHFQNGVPA